MPVFSLFFLDVHILLEILLLTILQTHHAMDQEFGVLGLIRGAGAVLPTASKRGTIFKHTRFQTGFVSVELVVRWLHLTLLVGGDARHTIVIAFEFLLELIFFPSVQLIFNLYEHTTVNRRPPLCSPSIITHR